MLAVSQAAGFMYPAGQPGIDQANLGWPLDTRSHRGSWCSHAAIARGHSPRERGQE